MIHVLRRRTGLTKDRIRDFKRFLVEAEELPEKTWRSRHRVILVLLAAHVPALYIFATVQRIGPFWHRAGEVSIVAAVGAVAAFVDLPRRYREVLATFGLMTCSALLVHISHGTIEAHFHFFVMLAVVSLYQSWVPFLLAIVYVVAHHGLGGLISPEQVYNHPGALRSPVKWAGIHALFVSGASVVYVVMWRLNESARNEARDLYRRLYEGQRSIVQQLETTSKMSNELISVVSHELRTPLTTILGYTELLQMEDGLDEEESRDALDRIARQGERLRFLIENLLTYQKIDAEETETTEVGPVIRSIVETQGDFPGAQEVEIKSSLQDGLVARISEKGLNLIIANLLNNAVKFAERGSIVDVDAYEDPAAEVRTAVLAVTNEGPTISAEDHDRIFGAFTQLDSSITRGQAGVGLGLFIVRETVRAYDGAIDIVSEGKKVTFRVKLPVAGTGERAA